MKPSFTNEQLWHAQLEFWPNSIELTPQEILHWVFAAKSPEQRCSRALTVCMAIQHPTVLWYRTHTYGEIGCRYGINGPDYISGFI
jgi:hypothetical protein